MRRLLTLLMTLLATTMTIAAPTKSGYIDVNGVNYYYETHGEIGPPTRAANAASGATSEKLPLLLLHGGLGSIDMFGPVLPALAKSRKVIAVDLQGHGRTALGDRPFKLESIGDDMAAIVKS